MYKTVKAVLSSGHEIALYDVAGEEEVSVSIRHRKGNTDASILDINSAGGSAWLSGKSSIDVSGYRSIFDVGGDTISPVRDENGQMKPYTECAYPLSCKSSRSRHPSGYTECLCHRPW